MLENGFIVLNRKILNWEWYDDVNVKILFLHLLLTVNYEDKNWRGITIKRGQRVTSISKLSAETKLSVKQIRTALNKLIATNEVANETTAQHSIITVNNYSKYQDRANETASEGQTEGKRGANEGQQWNKDNKANKEKQNIYMPDFEKFWKAYPKKVGKQSAIKIFQKIDPMSEELFEKIIAEVEWQKKFGSMQDKQYCKDPERWLRDKRWEDERIERNTFQNGNSSQQPKGEEDKRQWLFPPKQA